jgi:hypothetical protein
MVGVVQRLEHWTVAPGVGGSNPLAHPILRADGKEQATQGWIVTDGVRFISCSARFAEYAPVAQWIEHRPPEPGVGGSTPLRRASKFHGMKFAGMSGQYSVQRKET